MVKKKKTLKTKTRVKHSALPPTKSKVTVNGQVRALIQKHPWQFMIGFTVMNLIIAGIIFAAALLIINQFKKAATPKFEERIENVKKVDEKKYAILQDGQTIWDLAEKELGTGYAYPTIIELNKLTNPDSVEPGTRLRVK
jgi:hypothetical protein